MVKISELVGSKGSYNFWNDQKAIMRTLDIADKLIQKVAVAQPQQAQQQQVLIPKSEVKIMGDTKVNTKHIDANVLNASMDALFDMLDTLPADLKKQSIETVIMAYKNNIMGQKDQMRQAGSQFAEQWVLKMVKE